MSVTKELSEEIQRLWDIRENTPLDVIRAVQFLSLQNSRTSFEDLERLRTLIDSLSTLPSHGTSLEYIDYNEVTDDEFSERFSAKLRPCMIRNCCEKDKWRARERWHSGKDLMQWYPHIPIRITEMKSHPGAKSEPVRIPLANYISYSSKDSGGADFPWYGFDDNLRLVRDLLMHLRVLYECTLSSEERSSLTEDYVTPSYFRDDCYGAHSAVLLAINSAWRFLLSVRCRQMLAPPLDTHSRPIPF